MIIKSFLKANYKYLKFLFKNYKRLKLSDFFHNKSVLKKYHSLSWRRLKNWSKTKLKKIKRMYLKKNNLKFNSIIQKEQKLIRPRIPYLIQTDTFLNFTKFIGNRKMITKQHYFRKIFIALLFNLYNNTQIKKRFEVFIHRSKASSLKLYTHILNKYSNNIKNIIAIHKFIYSKPNIIYMLSKYKFLIRNKQAIKSEKINTTTIKTGDIIKLRPNIFILKLVKYLKDIMGYLL